MGRDRWQPAKTLLTVGEVLHALYEKPSAAGRSTERAGTGC